jgi:pyruvate dehydrogenase E2 component (dihydrolipoamide acetyltransferase)
VFEFKLPDLGEGIHEGEILKWYVQPGDTINEDDPLVEIETDKAAVTVPSPKSGKIVSLSGGVGDTVDVGDVIVVIDENGKAEAKQADKPGKEAEKRAEKKPERIKGSLEPEEKEEPEKAEVEGERPRRAEEKPEGKPAEGGKKEGEKKPGRAERERVIPAAPATRRLARELGVDLRKVKATGPAGRVTSDDVQRFASGEGAPAEEGAPSKVEEGAKAQAEYAARAASAIPFLDIEPLPDFSQYGRIEKEPLRSIRRKVAHKMVTSMILIPHVTHMDEADVTELEEFRIKERKRLEGRPGGHLTLLAFVVKAAAAGLRAAPAFNASIDFFNEEIVYKKYYNIGVAVDTGKGLVVPVVKQADCKSILQISEDITRLSGAARDGKLEVADLKGGTFSITNVGPLGGTALVPAINYPESAILGMGKVQQKPVVRDGQIVIRNLLPLALSFDHRIADGADAARFVSEMIRHLSDPNLLLLET